MSVIPTNDTVLRKNAFTIVELLIVIVVIAILAAISVVAYNGIQNRTYDSLVKSDIAALVKTIRLYEAENDELPVTGGANFPGITFAPSQSAYSVDNNNLFFCSGLISNERKWLITARSKSGQVFFYAPENGLQPTESAQWNRCRYNGWDADTFGYSYGYSSSGNGSWMQWAN